MAYRDGEANALRATTADGTLALAIAPDHVALTVGAKTLQLNRSYATLIEQGRKRTAQASLSREGKLWVARGVPREDLGVWIELPDGVRRIFGVAAQTAMTDEAVAALPRLDAIAGRLRSALANLGGWTGRGVEIGHEHPLDKVLLAEVGDEHRIYARALFRDRAKLVATIHRGGRVVTADGEVVVTSRFQITVWGDYLRFSDQTGTDRTRASIPWIAREERHELARRIGHLLDPS